MVIYLYGVLSLHSSISTGSKTRKTQNKISKSGFSTNVRQDQESNGNCTEVEEIEIALFAQSFELNKRKTKNPR